MEHRAKPFYDIYTRILCEELKPALGCTEPVAIAYAAATAVAALGKEPESLSVSCSGNVVKNVKGVTVPNSGGMKGIEAAAILGAIGGFDCAAWCFAADHRARKHAFGGNL